MWKRGRRADQGPDQTRHPQASGQLFSSYSLETGSWSWGFGTYLAAVCPVEKLLSNVWIVLNMYFGWQKNDQDSYYYGMFTMSLALC